MAPKVADQLTPEEVAAFRAWVAAGQPPTMPEGLEEFEALTHLSVHRDQHPFHRGEQGADLVRRGEKVLLDKARSSHLLRLGAIRPWEDREKGKEVATPTAADMSGKEFPDQNKGPEGHEQITATDPTKQPEATDPQPPAPGKDATATTATVTDPYAK